MTIAKAFGGGENTFLWAMDADAYVIDTIFMTLNRMKVAEAISNMARKDRPTRSVLENYSPRHDASEDIAFSELFPMACQWLNDRDADSSKEEDSPDLSQWDRFQR